MTIIGTSYTPEEFLAQFPEQVYSKHGLVRNEIRNLGDDLYMVITRETDPTITHEFYLGGYVAEEPKKAPYVDLAKNKFYTKKGPITIRSGPWSWEPAMLRWYVPANAETVEDMTWAIRRTQSYGEYWNYEDLTVTIYYRGLEIAQRMVGAVESDCDTYHQEELIGELVAEINKGLRDNLKKAIRVRKDAIALLRTEQTMLHALQHGPMLSQIKDSAAMAVKI